MGKKSLVWLICCYCLVLLMWPEENGMKLIYVFHECSSHALMYIRKLFFFVQLHHHHNNSLSFHDPIILSFTLCLFVLKT